MPADWEFAFLVPHSQFTDAVEFGPVALVPNHDDRLAALASRNPPIRVLTERFEDQFGRKLAPSAILRRTDAPASVDFNAIVAFRNSVSIASIIDATILKATGGTAVYPLWSDFFDFYPFIPHGQTHLAAMTIAKGVVNKADTFHGQLSPSLPCGNAISFGLDDVVLTACRRQWSKRFLWQRSDRESSVLFRALEVAFIAQRMPAIGTRSPTIHDIGTGMALWVSAFEILCHPGTTKVSLQTVLDRLGKEVWNSQHLRRPKFSVTIDKKNGPININWIQRFYLELYNARNAFLHGNSVTRSRLYPQSESSQTIPLLSTAPLIFRAAMLNSLPKPRFRSISDQLLCALRRRSYEDAVWNCRPRAAGL